MNVFKTYLLNCSFHGLPFVADSRFHWSERLFWVISVVLSWGAAVYVMFSSYNQFKNSAISFSVSTSYLNWKTNFPAIIFCEKGNIKSHNFAQIWFGNDRDFDTDYILNDIIFFKGGLEGVSYKCITEACPLAAGNYSFYADTIRSKCNELFQFCSWNNETFPCCEHILPVNTIYGVCYGINSIVNRVKSKNPLAMTVSYTANASVGIFAVELLNPDTKVFALSQEAVPSYTDDSSIVMDGISTSPHYKEENTVFLSVKVIVVNDTSVEDVHISTVFQEMVNDIEVEKVSIERRGCRFPEENYLKSSKLYSYSACTADCLVDLQIQACNCTHHLMPATENKKVCNMKGLICLSRGYDNIIKQTVECDCDSSCTETEVKIIGSTSTQNFSGFAHGESITRLNFILLAPTLRYMRLVVNGYLDLIVSMGGTAGLCVGASLLTTVEIFYYFLVRPLYDSRSQRQRKRRRIRKHRKNYKKPPFPFIN